MIKVILSGIIAYLLGSVTFGMIVPRLMGSDKDVRDEGSGNVGATNVLRTQGKRQGVLVLIGDLLKGSAAAGLGLLLAGPAGGGAAGACALLGHCYPLYFGFKGGKGVATAAGAVIVLFPKSMLFLVPVFVVAILGVRMVSVGSLAGAVTLAICLWMYPQPLPVTLCCMFAAAMIVGKHRGNIKRILSGTESKLW